MNRIDIKYILKENRIQPKKSFGQNFLINEKILDKMIGFLDIQKEDFILEIGPGLGILTEKLALNANCVLAIEKDRKIVEYLRNYYKNYKKIKIVCDDALFFDLKNIKAKYKVAANLPYNITSPIIRKLLSDNNKPEKMVLMMQKEVAERICAKAGSSQRGYLTLLVEYYAKAQIILNVGKEAFYPSPNVDSAIVGFEIIKRDYKNNEAFFNLIKIGFSQKRRQIFHPLSSGLHIDKNRIKNILTKINIDYTKRAEDLSLENWVKLQKQIIKYIDRR